jgi:Txe/YoeB family toxin of Txe-Axe toxin-antitoxin module
MPIPWRINVQQRLAYQMLGVEHTAKVLRMWSHHE